MRNRLELTKAYVKEILLLFLKTTDDGVCLMPLKKIENVFKNLNYDMQLLEPISC